MGPPAIFEPRGPTSPPPAISLLQFRGAKQKAHHPRNTRARAAPVSRRWGGGKMIHKIFFRCKTRLWQTLAWPRDMKHCRLDAVCGRSAASSMASKGWYQDRVPRPEPVTRLGRSAWNTRGANKEAKGRRTRRRRGEASEDHQGGCDCEAADLQSNRRVVAG